MELLCNMNKSFFKEKPLMNSKKIFLLCLVMTLLCVASGYVQKGVGKIELYKGVPRMFIDGKQSHGMEMAVYND